MSSSSDSTRLLPFVVAALYCVLFFFTDHNFWISQRLTDPSLIQATVESLSGNTRQRPAALLCIAVSAVVLLTRNPRQSFRIDTSIAVVVLSYFSWAWASYLWATDPFIALKRLASFSSLLLAAFAVSRVITRRDFVSVVCGITSTYLAIGFATELVLGTFQPLNANYRFMGTTNPAGQGLNCGIVVFTTLVIADGQKPLARRSLRLLAIAGLVFLVLSRSRGPFAGVIIAYLFYRTFTRKRLSSCLVPYLAVLLLSFLLLIIGWSGLRAAILLGREENVAELTGRIPLWVDCWHFVKMRPWTGYGFSGFWTELTTLDIAETQDWVTYSAHSIYLDTVLSLGFVGFALLMVALVISARRGLVAIRRSADNTPAALTGLLLLMCVDGLLSSLVITAAFTIFVLFSLIFYLSFTQSASGQMPHPPRTPSRDGPQRPPPPTAHFRSSAATR